MDSVVNNTAATSIQSFLVKLYKPIYTWATDMFATKTELAAIETPEQMTSTEAHAIWSGYTFSTTD